MPLSKVAPRAIAAIGDDADERIDQRLAHGLAGVLRRGARSTTRRTVARNLGPRPPPSRRSHRQMTKPGGISSNLRLMAARRNSMLTPSPTSIQARSSFRAMTRPINTAGGDHVVAHIDRGDELPLLAQALLLGAQQQEVHHDQQQRDDCETHSSIDLSDRRAVRPRAPRTAAAARHAQVAANSTRTASNLPSLTALRSRSISANVQLRLWMVSRRPAAGSPTMNRWRK